MSNAIELMQKDQLAKIWLHMMAPWHPLELDIINIFKEEGCKEDYKAMVLSKQDFDERSASRYENPSQPKKSALYEPPWRKRYGKDCAAVVTLSNKVDQERKESIRKTWRKIGGASPNRASITWIDMSIVRA